MKSLTILLILSLFICACDNNETEVENEDKDTTVVIHEYEGQPSASGTSDNDNDKPDKQPETQPEPETNQNWEPKMNEYHQLLCKEHKNTATTNDRIRLAELTKELNDMRKNLKEEEKFAFAADMARAANMQDCP